MASTTCTYRTPSGRPLSQIGISALLASSMLVGGTLTAGAVSAAPQQGGINAPEPSAPQQGGINPTPAPPQQQGGITPTQPEPAAPTPPAPSYNPGPMGLPSAPSAPPSAHVAPDAPTYEGNYNPVPVAPIHAPNPSAPKVKRIAPKPKTLRIGNFEEKVDNLPDFPNKTRTIDWANGWSSYGEQEIANFLISIGIPPDQATRQAAATIAGAAAGGALGGTIGFTTTTIFVGTFTVPIGAGVGALLGSTMGNPVSILGGAGLGAAAGAGVAVGTGVAVGSVTAIIGALIGGGLGYALGTGDPGGKVKRPNDNLPQQDAPGKHRKVEPLPNPDGNQFEVRLAKDDAAKAGLPPVDYVVSQRGDVTLDVAGTEVNWSAEQAQAPIKALGPAAPVAEKVINDVTRTVTTEAQKAISGLQVTWPQLDPKPAKKPAAAPAR